VSAWLAAERDIFAPMRRAAQVASHLPQLFLRGGWFPSLIELGDLAATCMARKPAAGRTYIAGTDTPPPETVPLTDADFDDEDERRRIMQPWRVTDDDGRALAQWMHAEAVFRDRAARGRAIEAALAAAPASRGA